MKTQVYFLRSSKAKAHEDFVKFAYKAAGLAGHEVKILEHQMRIETPLMEIRFRSLNEKAIDGIRADITIPYDPAIMAASKFGRKDCDENKIFGAFCMELDQIKEARRKGLRDMNPIDEMHTAENLEEFEAALKRGQPFQIKPKAQIMIASIDTEKPPICRIQGRDDEIVTMTAFGISNIMSEQIDHGMTPDAVLEMWHEVVRGAFNAEMDARKHGFKE